MKHFVNSLKHLFLPHEGNNFRSKLLHHDFLTVYLVFAISLTFGISHFQREVGSILGYATDISPQKLFELTNRERERANLGTLTYNDQLARAAQKKAEHMFANQYWSHYGPSGETPWQFIVGEGYRYLSAGENLAKNFLFSDGVVAAWMDSPSHRDNILKDEYTDVGFGIVNGVLNGEETTLVVQMFGKPLYAPLAQEKGVQSPGAAPAEEPVPVTNPAGTVVNDVTRIGQPNASSPAFYSIFLNVNVIFFTVLILALALDLYFASKLNLIHLKGKNLIHMLFIATIAAGTYYIIRGAVV